MDPHPLHPVSEAVEPGCDLGGATVEEDFEGQKPEAVGEAEHGANLASDLQSNVKSGTPPVELPSLTLPPPALLSHHPGYANRTVLALSAYPPH